MRPGGHGNHHHHDDVNLKIDVRRLSVGAERIQVGLRVNFSCRDSGGGRRARPRRSRQVTVSPGRDSLAGGLGVSAILEIRVMIRVRAIT